MISLNILKDFMIEFDNDEILRQLKAKNTGENSRPAPESLIDEIEEMKEYAKPLIRCRVIYDIFKSENLEPRFLFKKSEKTVLAICTIGKELETHVENFLKNGELAKGTILNAIASHAAEQTAEYVNLEILRNLSKEIEGKNTTCRFSPGYCNWDLYEGQKMIFNLLDGLKIGVNLTSSMMMNPVKSISFAINIGNEVDKEIGLRDCESCDMINCAYRRV